MYGHVAEKQCAGVGQTIIGFKADVLLIRSYFAVGDMTYGGICSICLTGLLI